MRILNFITIFVLALVIAGCAAETKGGIDAFKGQSAQHIYDGGMQYLGKKNYDAAVKNFEALEALYPFGKYAEPGQLNLIYSYYKNGDYDAASAVAERYIHLFPLSPNVPYAYYMRGMSNFDKNTSWLNKIYVKDPALRDLSSFEQAYADFNELVTRYPNSRYAQDARTRMIYIRNLIARYELFVAQFYYDREAYIAAANRANYVVEHFEGSPQVVEALKLMIKAYNKLGDTKSANEASRILKLNYPHNG
jgi:outer membrane protein assembly factor BamD